MRLLIWISLLLLSYLLKVKNLSPRKFVVEVSPIINIEERM